jgi:hypothetical protein
MAYKLLQSKAYNQVPLIVLGTYKETVWTVGGIAFAEQGEHELRLRKDTLKVDQRNGIAADLAPIIDNLDTIQSTHFTYEDDDVEVFAESGSLHFQSVYFEYLKNHYGFAQVWLDIPHKAAAFMASGKVLAILAARERIDNDS